MRQSLSLSTTLANRAPSRHLEINTRLVIQPKGDWARLLFVFGLLLLSTNTDADEVRQMLEQKLLVEQTLPVSENGSIPVEIGIKVDQITGINQQAENFSAVLTLFTRYADPLLAYTAEADALGFRMYRLSSFLQLVEEKGSRWPEIALLNQQGRQDLTSQAVALLPSGIVVFFSRLTTTFQAPDFDFRRFPFDHQRFHVRAALVLPEEIVHFVPMADTSGIGDQLGEEEWIIYDVTERINTTSNLTGLPSSEFVLSFSGHRHLLYYVMRIFLPMLIILLVSWFTFQLKDYVKRIDLGITTLLLFIAFNFTVSSDLPRLGYITTMDALMTGAFVITGVVLMFNVYLRRLQTSGQESNAARLDKLAVWGYWPAYVVGTTMALLLI